MKGLQGKIDYDAICVRNHLHAIFQYFGFDGMGTGSVSRDQSTASGAQFEINLSCDMHMDQQIVFMIGKLILGDEGGFLRRCVLLEVVYSLNEQDGH